MINPLSMKKTNTPLCPFSNNVSRKHLVDRNASIAGRNTEHMEDKNQGNRQKTDTVYNPIVYHI